MSAAADRHASCVAKLAQAASLTLDLDAPKIAWPQRGQRVSQAPAPEPPHDALAALEPLLDGALLSGTLPAGVALLSQLGALARSAMRVTGAASPAAPSLGPAKFQLPKMIERLERTLAPYAISSPATTATLGSLLWSVDLLRQIKIDLFAKGASEVLHRHLTGLRRAGVLRSTFAAELSTRLIGRLLELASLSESLLALTGAAIGSIQAPALTLSGLEPMLQALRFGPLAELFSALRLPALSPSRLGTLSLQLGALRQSRLLEHLRLSGGRGAAWPADPLAAFAASGCCAVLHEFPDLAANAVRRAQTQSVARALAGSHRALGIDLGSPGAETKLRSCLDSLQSSLTQRVAPAVAALSVSTADVAQARRCVEILGQARALGVRC